MQSNNTVTAFISFDIVNSTNYKAYNPGVWGMPLSNILTYITAIFKKTGGNDFYFWKMLGDEIIFTNNITSLTEIELILQEVYKAVTDINKKIKNMELGDETTKDFLSVKSTVWLAILSNSIGEYNNYRVTYNIDGREALEYVGVDIDAGFRMTDYASTNRVIISYQTAALYLRVAELNKHLHKINFIGHRRLKGIWKDRNFPLFIYHDDENVSFEQSVIDDKHKSPILEEYLIYADEIKEDKPLKDATIDMLKYYSKKSVPAKGVEEVIDLIIK